MPGVSYAWHAVSTNLEPGSCLQAEVLYSRATPSTTQCQDLGGEVLLDLRLSRISFLMVGRFHRQEALL